MVSLRVLQGTGPTTRGSLNLPQVCATETHPLATPRSPSYSVGTFCSTAFMLPWAKSQCYAELHRTLEVQCHPQSLPRQGTDALTAGPTSAHTGGCQTWPPQLTRPPPRGLPRALGGRQCPRHCPCSCCVRVLEKCPSSPRRTFTYALTCGI